MSFVVLTRGASMARSALVVAALLLLTATTSVAQPPDNGLSTVGQDFPGAGQDFPGGDPFSSPFGGGTPEGQEVVFDASFTIIEGTNQGEVSVTATIAPGWHIYSLTQPVGVGPGPSTITLPANPNVKLTGDFAAESDPHVIENHEIFQARVEEYSDRAIFTAPIEIVDVDDPSSFSFELVYDGQTCDAATCKLLTGIKLNARFDRFVQPATVGSYDPEGTNVTWSGHVEPKVVEPGGVVRIVFTATPDEGYHVYRFGQSFTEEDQAIPMSPTLIALTNRNGWAADLPRASIEATPHEVVPGKTAYWHSEPITWTVELAVPKRAEKKDYEFSGFLGWQTCDDASCTLPMSAEFSATITVGSDTDIAAVPLSFNDATIPYAEVSQLSANIDWGAGTAAGGWDDKPLITIFALAFLAGLILNVMPCVLPVIGLKILSFVDQAGGSRWTIFRLNLWFSLGLVSVFLLLATLGAVFGMGWGQHFQNAGFTISLACIVFVFGLSFFGVWEIPIPGFVGTGSTAKMAEKEGFLGAFSKGVLTTILATPCTGPFLVPAITWSLGQPPVMTYTLFLAVGLGMASPYLLIGVFPKLIAFLPRPGAWMSTFKQFMGFVLMGTVVFLLSSLPKDIFIPALVLLLGLGLGCWWIGRTPVIAEFGEKFKAWAGGILISAAVGAIAFWMAASTELDWQPFGVSIEDQVASGNTVLVDFTADW